MLLNNLAVRLLLAATAIACASTSQHPADNEGVKLPFLLEHNLPNKVQLLTGDSVVVFATLYNTSRLPALVKYGSAALKIDVHEVRSSPRPAISMEPHEIGDRVQHWGAVRYLQSPSPYAVYTTELTERTLKPGDSLRFSWRADPLPDGEYSLRICLDLLESPRRGEGGWQNIRWCAARHIELTVAAKQQ